MGDTNQTSSLTSRVFLLIRIGLRLLHSVHSVVRDPHVGMGLADEPGVGGLEVTMVPGRGGEEDHDKCSTINEANSLKEIVHSHQRFVSVHVLGRLLNQSQWIFMSNLIVVSRASKSLKNRK